MGTLRELMRKTADAVVIGAGILGTSIGFELAGKGFRTIVVDKNAEVGRGSTRASAAVIRCCYGTRPGVALAFEGRHVFERWPEHLGLERPRARFERVGCALLHPVTGGSLEGLERMMQAVGCLVESLSGREAEALVPGIRAARTRVLFESGAGYITSAALATRDARRAAEARAVRFLLGESVVEIKSEFEGRNGGRRIKGVTTASGLRISTPIVVNAAGPHSSMVNLLARAPLPITTVPLGQRYIRGKLDASPAPSGLPVVADLPSGHYVRFDRGDFRLGTLGGRDDVDFLPSADVRPKIPKSFLAERKRAFLKRHPGMRWKEAKSHTALYDVTVMDWYPILDRTRVDGYYVAIGTSGAWFKGGPTIGHLMANLVEAVEGGRDHDADPLRVRLPYSGAMFDLGFLSRNRRPIESESGTGALG